MKKIIGFLGTLLLCTLNQTEAQVRWLNMDTVFQPLPLSVHVYKTMSLLDGKPNIAYYVSVDLKDKKSNSLLPLVMVSVTHHLNIMNNNEASHCW